MTLPVPTQFPREMGGAAPLALAAFTVALSEPKGMCFHLLRRTVLCVSVWLEMFLVSLPSVPLVPARLPHSQIAVLVFQNGEVECSFTPCPELECPREEWLLGPGQCCFTCREPTPTTGCSLDDNGVEFPIGQIWSPGDPCRRLCELQEDRLRGLLPAPHPDSWTVLS